MGPSPTFTPEAGDLDSNSTSLGKSHLMTTVTTVSVGNSKPPPLSPPLSIFSTYNKRAKKIDPLTQENRSHAAPWEVVELSKTSFSSIEVGWQPAQDGELDAPKNVQKVESREKLVPKGMKE